MIQELPQVPYPDTYWVVPGKFLAGEHPLGFYDQPSEARLAALLKAGVRTFIDLTEEHKTDGYALTLRCLAEERQLAISYIRVPIPDQGVPSVWTMRRILDLVDRSLADDQPVFVHCFAGRGRTGTVVGCHLRRGAQAKPAEAVDRIMELRRFMPSGREESPQTSEQNRMVECWKDGA